MINTAGGLDHMSTFKLQPVGRVLPISASILDRRMLLLLEFRIPSKRRVLGFGAAKALKYAFYSLICIFKNFI